MSTFGALLDHSTPLCGWSNHNWQLDDLFRYQVTLYRHRDGRYFLASTGGAAMAAGKVRWIDDREALVFVSTHANDPVSGYGFTADEAAAMLAGQTVKGTREFEGRRLPCPAM